MSLLDRLLGKDRRARAAKRAEVGGNLVRAAELWLEAGRPDEAARVLIDRSDTELEPKVRLVLLGQAVSLAPASSEHRAAARKKRALLRLELAKTGALAAALRHDLREAAADLEALGDPESAAEAFRLVGDQEGRERALIAAGAVDELEEVLQEDARFERSSRELRSGVARVEALQSSGDRRAALAESEALLLAHPTDAGLRERRDALRSAKLVGPVVRVSVDEGAPLTFVLGKEVRIGRNDGEILIAHNAISKTHARLFRDGAGVPHLVDAGSRNGTTLRGVKIGGPLPIAAETEVELGGEVPLRLVPLEDRVRLEVAGRVYFAPLGPARVGRDWQLLVEDDGWIALHAESTTAYVGALAMGRTTQLLAGDAFSRERGGAAALRVER